MAHFARISANNRVLQVLRVPDDHEHRGEEYLAVDCRLGGRWLQTSYNGSMRRRFAGIGMVYDPDRDMFLLPQPFESWSLDANADWQPPVPHPGDGSRYRWDEAAQTWVLMPEPESPLTLEPMRRQRRA